MSDEADHSRPDRPRPYAALLDGWLGISSKDVLGQKFDPVDVLKA